MILSSRITHHLSQKPMSEISHQPSPLLAVNDSADRRQRAWDLIVIGVAWIAAAVVLRPFQDAPFVDDWVYAWSVEHLLETGELRIIEYSASINPIQTLWGALFCLPAGFSFTALRISTYVAALIGVWMVYLLARDLGAGRIRAMIAAAVLAVHPVYYILSCSYMTDVPLTAAMMAFTCACVRMIQRRSDQYLILSVLLACVACGIRLVGSAAIGALGMVLLVHCDSWGRRRLAWAIIPAAVMALFIWNHEQTAMRMSDPWDIGNSPAHRVANMWMAWYFLPSMTLLGTLTMARDLGIGLLAFSLATFSRERLKWSVALFVVLIGLSLGAIATGQPCAAPLAECSIWSFRELGLAEELLAGFRPSRLPGWLGMLLLASSLGLAAPVIVNLLPWRRAGQLGQSPLWWSLAGHVALVILLWLFRDRYFLPMLGLCAVLAATNAPVVRERLAGWLVAAMALITLAATADHLRFNAALWQGVDYLRSQAIPLSQIDAGYVVNGWQQYAHPENAARDANGAVQVPMVNSKLPLRYAVSSQSESGAQVLKTIPYCRWIGPSGSLYVLDRGE